MAYYHNSTAHYNGHDLFTPGERGLAAAGIGPKTRDILAFYGIRSASDAIGMTASELQRLPGIGERLAARLLALVWVQ